MQKQTKKYLGVGAGLLLLVGVATGGAFVTLNSTVFDNIFNAAPYDPAQGKPDGELQVTGSPLNYTFTGLQQDERVSGIFTVTNTSTNGTLTFDVKSFITGGTRAQDLASALTVEVSVDGAAPENAGLLSEMTLGQKTIAVAPGASKTVRLNVYIADIDSYRAAGLENGAQAKVDFQFDSIFSPVTRG